MVPAAPLNSTVGLLWGYSSDPTLAKRCFMFDEVTPAIQYTDYVCHGIDFLPPRLASALSLCVIGAFQTSVVVIAHSVSRPRECDIFYIILPPF